MTLERVAAGRPERSMVLSGLRGVGKTVLLNALRGQAVRRAWGTGKIEARPDQSIRIPVAQAVHAAVREVAHRHRDPDRVDDTAAEIEALERKACRIAQDVSDAQSAARGVQQAVDALGGLDILVNNAGTEEVRASVAIDEALWDKIIDTNLKGAFFCAQAAAKHMIVGGTGGSIINLLSLTSAVGIPTAVPYGTSKTGLLGMTRALAAEWAPHGIRVNGIAPGYFRTAMTEAFYQRRGLAGANAVAHSACAASASLTILPAPSSFLPRRLPPMSPASCCRSMAAFSLRSEVHMTASINLLRLADLSPEARAQLLKRTESDLGPYLEKVKPIIEAVRTEGDEALARFARDFDKAPVDAKRIAASEEDFERAHKRA